MPDTGLAEQVASRLVAAGLAPPLIDALAKELCLPERELRTVVEYLARTGSLVRVSSSLYFARRPVEELRARVVSYLEANDKIDPAGYKELTGQTRKYTVPLMEHFDTEKLTLRQGNFRILRGGPR